MFYQPERLMFGGDQTVAIMCSSGTTGFPKAVCISNSAMPVGFPIISSEDMIYSTSSLGSLSSVVFLMFSVAEGCTRIIGAKPFSPDYFVEIVGKYKVNVTLLAPALVTQLLAPPLVTPEKLSSLRMIQLGGGCISAMTMQKLKSITRQALVFMGYGCTESGPISAGLCGEFGNSVGGVRLRIVSHNGRTWNGYYGNSLESRGIQDSIFVFRRVVKEELKQISLDR